MPLGDGISGYGTELEGSVAGAIGMITNISHSYGVSVDIDISTMASPQKWMQFISGMLDAKEMSLNVLYEKSQEVIFMAALGVSQTWTITFPDGSTFACAGYLKDVGSQVPMNDKISQTVNFKRSGVPVFTPGS